MNAPEIQGKYAVGSFVKTLVDDSRDEKVGPLINKGKRKITIRVFYPVNKEDVEGKNKAFLLSRNLTKAMQREFFIPINYDKICKSGSNYANYYEDVPFIKNERFPLVLFSHGYKSYIEGNHYLCSEICSQGYVVISIGHPYEAMLVEHEDGQEDYFYKPLMSQSIKPFIPGILAMTKLQKLKASPEEQYQAFLNVQNKYNRFMVERMYEWVLDSEFVLNQAKSLFSNIIDFESGVAASGHSMGGAVAYALCHKNDEISCGLNIDGGLFGNYEGMIMKKPFFQICSENNYSVETKPMLNKTEPAYYATFKKIKHIAFADVMFFINIKSITGSIPKDLSHNTLCKCHIDFLDKYIKKKNIEIDVPNSKYIKFERF